MAQRGRIHRTRTCRTILPLKPSGELDMIVLMYEGKGVAGVVEKTYSEEPESMTGSPKCRRGSPRPGLNEPQSDVGKDCQRRHNRSQEVRLLLDNPVLPAFSRRASLVCKLGASARLGVDVDHKGNKALS